MESRKWNEKLIVLGFPHFLQSEEWASIKAPVGWRSEQREWKDENGNLTAAAQLLVRSVKILGFGPRISIGYIPRGPLMDWENELLRYRVLNDLHQWALENRLVFLKIDPEVEAGRGIPDEPKTAENPLGKKICEELTARGWRYSFDQIQFKNTLILDLKGTEETWLARMKQKTRYNLRLAQKSGVMVRTAHLDELPMLYKMYAETAERDGFIIRPEKYYLEVWDKFIKADMAEALIAEVEGMPVAGLVYFHLGNRAWYVYGMSAGVHREKMPNNLLQWEAMRSARAKGCMVYDLWGAPEIFTPEDPMYGVLRFKEGLGGSVLRTIGAWDLPIKKTIYFLYQKVIPRILSVTRSIRRRQIQQEVQ